MRPELTDSEMKTGAASSAASESFASWPEIKSRFVDDPAGAIAAAEEQVGRTLDQQIRALREEADRLCAHGRDEDASSTEDLRLRLLRCEAYCDRLTPTVH